MSEFIKEAVVKISADVSGLNTGMDTAGAKVSGLETKLKGASVAGNKMGGMLGDNVGKKLGAFNEKTEKGRQLVTAFAGTTGMGGAAGSAIYYGGTLSYVVGRFSAVELAVMATVGSLTALGVAFYQWATGPGKEALEMMEDLTSEMEKQVKKTQDLIDNYWLEVEGLNKWEKAARETSHTLSTLSNEMAKIDDKLSEQASRRKSVQDVFGLGSIGVGIGALLGNDALSTAEKFFEISDRQMVNYDVAFGNAKQLTAERNKLLGIETTIVEQQDVTKKLGGKTRVGAGSGGGKVEDEDWHVKMMEDDAKRFEMAQAAYWRDAELQKAVDDKYLAAQVEHEESKQAILVEYANKRMEWKEEQAELEYSRAESVRKKELDRAQEYAATGLDIIYAAADGGVKGVARYLSGRLKILSYEAAAKAAFEAVEAIAAYARYDYASGSLHATAAVQYAAFAAVSAAGAIVSGNYGSSGAGSGGGVTSSSDFYDDSEDTGSEKGSVNIYVDGNYFQSRDADSQVAQMIERNKDATNPGRYRTEVD